MTIRSIEKVARQSWDAIQITDTVIARVNTLGQGQPNDLEFLDYKNHSIGELDTTRLNAGKTESPHIELTEPETDLDRISAGNKTLPELGERQGITTIELGKYMGITKEDVTLEAEEQRTDPAVPSLVEREIMVNIFPEKIYTP